MLGTILIAFAFVFLILESLSCPEALKFKWGWMGVALFVLGIMLGPITLTRLFSS